MIIYIYKIIKYDNTKINELLNDKGIIRNKLKIYSSISNSNIYNDIILEYSSFKIYLSTFTNNMIIYETNNTTNYLSDTLSKDLKKRGMKFVESTTIYSYLQAIGLINSHEDCCYKYQQIEERN